MLGLIAEAVEKRSGEALEVRTAALARFQRLGPADLVVLEKTTKSKRDSAYHQTTGVDVSSPAAVAAHISILATVLGETQVWFNRAPQWKVSAGTYCSWNAFGGVDVRVSVDIPGSTRAEIVLPGGVTKDVTDLEPEKQDQLWQEVAMSAFVRALIYTDDDSTIMELCRREDPLPTPSDVERFCSIFEKLYFRGALLGAGQGSQHPWPESNLMVDALYKALESTGAYEPAVQMLQRLSDVDASARLLLARVYLMCDREVEAASLMVSSVRESPANGQLLTLEGQFLLRKGPEYYDLALDCAERASWAAPTDFFSWECLARVYIAKGDFGEALLALNSAPLIASRGMDRYTLPEPKKKHVPIPNDGSLDEVWALDPSTHDEEDDGGSVLPRLPGGLLQPGSATAVAYSLLTDIYRQIGWKALMQLRADVFWMQTELDSSQGQPNVRQKRLCERRLDNLFMALYEDSRAFTSIMQEILHYESQKLSYAKPAKEWELFGILAQRLGHEKEARDAYRRSLRVKFSHRILWKQLDAVDIKKEPHVALSIVVKLLTWDHRWYIEYSPRLTQVLREIVATEGLTQMSNELEAEFGKTGVMPIVHAQLNRLKTLQVKGYDL